MPLHCIIEAWKGDHVLDDKTILPSDGAPPPRTLFPSQFQTQPHTAVYKPAMRFAAALPEEKPKIKEKKKKKKKNDKKSTDGDGTSSPSPEPTATDSSNTGSPGSPDDVTVPGAPTPPPAPGAPSPYPSPAGEYSTSVGMYPGYEYTGYQAGGYSADAYTAGYYSGYGYPVGMYPSYASPPRIPDSSYVTPPYPAVTISASLSPYTQPPVVVAPPATTGGKQTKDDRGGRGGKAGRGGRGSKGGENAAIIPGLGPSSYPRISVRVGGQGVAGVGIHGGIRYDKDEQPSPYKLWQGKYYHEAVFQLAQEELMKMDLQPSPPLRIPKIAPSISNKIGTMVLENMKHMAPTKQNIEIRSNLRKTLQKVLRGICVCSV